MYISLAYVQKMEEVNPVCFLIFVVINGVFFQLIISTYYHLAMNLSLIHI